LISEKKIDDIETQINQNGYWELKDEWRISTVTVMRIEQVKMNNIINYKVSVKCDQEFTCVCPVLTRAIEFLELYEDLIQKTWASNGWPSWTTKKQL